MEYQPFDFDKLDALLRECEALSGDARRLTRNPLAARVRLIPSTTALATRTHSAAGPLWSPTPRPAVRRFHLQSRIFRAAHPSRESAAQRRITESSPRRRRYEEEAPQPKPRKKSSSGRRRPNQIPRPPAAGGGRQRMRPPDAVVMNWPGIRRAGGRRLGNASQKEEKAPVSESAAGAHSDSGRLAVRHLEI